MNFQFEDIFVTKIASGHIDISEIKSAFVKWVEITKLIEDDISTQSTTNNGWQYAFKPEDRQPDWNKFLFDKLNFSEQIKSSWVVAYDKGGYQDTHIHAHSKGTLIVNLIGSGDLILYDPRPTAVALSEPYSITKTLYEGDWIYIPGWLAHSSKPCSDKRLIYVIDLK